MAGKVLRISLVALALSLALGFPAGSAGQEPWPVPRMSGPITLDGRVDEAAWEAIPPLPAVQQVPEFGAEPSEATEFRVGYDDDYLYFSCRARDSDPSGIRGPSLERDDGSFTNDWCVLNVDAFDDNQTAILFGTSPEGIRTDAVFANDATSPPNFDFDTFWDVAVSRDGEGWYAEIRIPLSTLRFQREPESDRVVMGLAAWRNIARKNELVIWPRISPQWGGFSFAKASQFRDASFRGLRREDPVYLTPYLLGGTGRSTGLNDPGTEYVTDTETVSEIGGDLKYGLASNLTMDLTVNTDFAQVEADDQQVNLTRFSLFFPEKRRFFQERASLFEFSLGGQERLFHSRRIGIVEGEQVPIHGGVRLVGRLADWDLGFLNMQTAATSLAPSENVGVLRARRRVLNQNSYVGGILTSRIEEGGGARNVVGAADAVVRLFGQDYLTLSLGRSYDDPGAGGTTSDEGLLARASWQRRVRDGLTYGLDLVRVSSAFEPGLGFLRRRDYTSGSARLGYGWRPGQESPVLTHGPTVDGAVFVRNDDGVAETVRVNPRWSLQLKSGHGLAAGLTATHEDLVDGFDLPDGATVPSGRHRFVTGELDYTRPNTAVLGANVHLEAGGFYDGRVVRFRVRPLWRLSRHLELSGTYQVDAVSLPDRDQSFTAHVARIRAQVTFSTTLSTFAFLQYSSTADRLITNLRFRYNPSEGHDLYVVWNEGLRTRRHHLDPVAPLSQRRTLLVKYSRTFTFGF